MNTDSTVGRCNRAGHQLISSTFNFIFVPGGFLVFQQGVAQYKNTDTVQSGGAAQSTAGYKSNNRSHQCPSFAVDSDTAAITSKNDMAN